MEHGEGNGNPLQYSFQGEPHGRRSLAGCKSMGSQGVRHDLATQQQQMELRNLKISVIRMWTSLEGVIILLTILNLTCRLTGGHL